jgi:periplasmic copper chaperone A
MKYALALAALLFATPVLADPVKVDNAWVRATAPGQKAAGAFMNLTATTNMTVLSGSSPAAKVVELHTMSMDNGVMIMRQIKDLPLPKGQTVSLKPGGLHVMLIDLNGQIKDGDKVPLTLTVRDANGKEQKLDVELAARQMGGMRPQHAH